MINRNANFLGTASLLAIFIALTATLSAASDADWQFVAGDVDRDNHDDLALIGNGEWYVWMSGQNYAMQGPYDLNLTGGLYAMGDLDGDQKPDLAMLSGPDWYLWRSGNNYSLEGPFHCGVSNGTPFLYDFDHDNKDDPCVVVGYTWHVWDSSRNYKKRATFGYNPGSSTGLIPLAWSTRKVWQGKLIITEYVGYIKDGRKRTWLHYRTPRYYGNFLSDSMLVQGMPVRGRFDGHPDQDLLIIQKHTDSFKFYTWLSGDNHKKRGPYTLRSGKTPGTAGMVWQDTNGCYAAATVYDIGDITNALVDVNGVPLKYNTAFSFRTQGGQTVHVNLPLYYAELPAIPSGSQVTLTVLTNGPAGPSLMYRSPATALPTQFFLTKPYEGARVVTGDPVPMAWTPANGAQGYLVSYDASDTPPQHQDRGWHMQYVPASQTAYDIPPECTITGYAAFGVAALAGDVEALLAHEDTNDFFLVTASWNEATVVVDNPIVDPLFIKKQYPLREKGLTFWIRESDPYLMPHAGRVTVDLRLRRRKLSIAFVAAFDMQGNPYFSWNKARIYKRKSKSYKVTFPCQPGSTIVIGTHKASFGGATYRY